MALTNAEKQQRWRERNQVVLTDRAETIAERLIDMEDQAKLRKISRFINDHLKHPDRDPTERAIALGRAGMNGLNGRLSKRGALERYRAAPQGHCWRVEAITRDGKRWSNGVRLDTKEEAEVYAEAHARYDLENDGYVTSEILRCDEPSNCSITRARAKGRPTLNFPDGQCVILNWSAITP
jgi:hypothetical protein